MYYVLYTIIIYHFVILKSYNAAATSIVETDVRTTDVSIDYTQSLCSLSTVNGGSLLRDAPK